MKQLLKKAILLAATSGAAMVMLPNLAHAANLPPVWRETADQIIGINETLTFTVQARDPEGDPITYSTVNLPFGATFDARTRIFSWSPNVNQIGSHTVIFWAYDQAARTEMDIVINVVNFSTKTPTPAPAPTPTPNPMPSPNPTPTPAPTPTSTPITPKETLKITDLKIELADGDVVVSWNTNIPAHARVIYDITSQGDKIKNFTYVNATPETRLARTEHKVTLKDLENDKMYFLRAVAKADSQVATSNEITLVILPGGRLQTDGLASAIFALGGFLINRWLLLLAVLIMGFLIWRHQREAKKVKI